MLYRYTGVIVAMIFASLWGCESSSPSVSREAVATKERINASLKPVPSTAIQTSEPYAKERGELVALLATRIGDKAVLDAMRAVERHRFVPERLRPYAYINRPLPIGERQTISQPWIVALMTQLLEIDATSRVLEIGTGSGYQAAVLAEMVREVYTIEIVESLGKQAEVRLQTLGYTNIRTRIGDGYEGWPEAAPFDAIIVTAAPDHVPQPLIDQLVVGGRLVLPVGERGEVQSLLRLTRNADGTSEEEDIAEVRFVPMTGLADEQ